MRELSDKVSKPVVGKNADGHIVERYLDVARALGCEVKKTVFPLGISDWEKSQAEKMLAQAGAKNNPYVFIAVGANWPNKRWPVRYMAKLCDWIYEQNIVPVLGGHGEIDERLASEVGRLAEIPPVSIVGRTPLRQLAHLLKNARLVLGGDTGTVHLAAAAGARVIMLMGPTDAARNGPYGQIENAIEADYACRHCWERSCKFNRECLEKITVEDVIKKMEPMLK
jgi:heptosyltransferase-1